LTGPLILHIETATDICSVAVSEGEHVVAIRESGPERSHASLLNKFIRDVSEESGYPFSALHAVAVSKGPGSYTGLRIGVSTAKGICYALRKPLLSCGTLENMAHGALGYPEVQALAGERKDVLLCPLLDARRMEVYSAFYSNVLVPVREVRADIIHKDSYADLLAEHPICFFGDGAGKCREVLISPNAHFTVDIHPSAAFMVRPVLERYRKKQFEDVAYFEPFYLKDFVATIPRKKVL
jgi:tRNA threonylcarbamoyladenosine biosynthesis protein TsaB